MKQTSNLRARIAGRLAAILCARLVRPLGNEKIAAAGRPARFCKHGVFMRCIRRSTHARRSNSLILSIGEKIVFPSHGPCLIDAVVHKLVGGTSASFYRLTRLDDSGGQLFIPVDKIRDFGIRRLLQRSAISELLNRLSRASKPTILPDTAHNWRRRAFDCSELLASGTAIDLVTVVRSLTGLSEARPLGARDRLVLERAKRLLVCEIAEVSGDARSAVAEQIDMALSLSKARSTRGPGAEPTQVHPLKQ